MENAIGLNFTKSRSIQLLIFEVRERKEGRKRDITKNGGKTVNSNNSKNAPTIFNTVFKQAPKFLIISRLN